MTNELREAAERRRNPYPRASKSGGKDYDSYYVHQQEWEDMTRLADAYADEHPPDDETPIDESWLRAVCQHFTHDAGWTDTAGVRFIVTVLGHSQVIDLDKDDVFTLPRLTTRGQLRRLCAALGIELKESP